MQGWRVGAYQVCFDCWVTKPPDSSGVFRFIFFTDYRSFPFRFPPLAPSVGQPLASMLRRILISFTFHCDPEFTAAPFTRPIVHIVHPCSAPPLRTHLHGAWLNQAWKTRILRSSGWRMMTRQSTPSSLSMTVMAVRRFS